MTNLDHTLEELIAYLEQRAINKSIEAIVAESQFSKEINDYISSLMELRIYKDLGLKETIVERKCLIMDIDFSFIDEKTGLTNYEKMAHGDPPIDAATNSVIHLHHIGKEFDSPFAELPKAIHESTKYSHFLHGKNTSSWRLDKQKERIYRIQKMRHWKIRSKEKHEK